MAFIVTNLEVITKDTVRITFNKGARLDGVLLSIVSYTLSFNDRLKLETKRIFIDVIKITPESLVMSSSK